MRLVIPAKAGIQLKIASAKGGFLSFCIWLKCYSFLKSFKNSIEDAVYKSW